MQVIANRPHHHFARVETHPHAQLQAPRAAHRLGGGLHGRLHGQGRVAGAQGVVFVGNRGTKQGHNAIAEHLIHRALEAVHGVHHAMEGRIEELLGGFGIEAPDEFGGVLEVGKEHGHLLALAFQGRAGREDLVGEMGWRVGQWRPLLGWCGGACRGCARIPGPDQHFALVIDRELLGVDEFVLERLEGLVIQLELELEDAIGHPAALAQQLLDLLQHLIKVHRRLPPGTERRCGEYG